MDERLRALQRRWRSSGDVEAGAAWLVGALRSGELTPLQLMCAAVLGDPAAERARVEADVPVLVPDPDGSPVWNDPWAPLAWGPAELLVRCGLAAVRRNLHRTEDTMERLLLEAADRAIAANDVEAAEAALWSIEPGRGWYGAEGACVAALALRGDRSQRLRLRDRYPHRHSGVELTRETVSPDPLLAPPGPAFEEAWRRASRHAARLAGYVARSSVGNGAEIGSRGPGGRLDRGDLARLRAEAQLAAAVAREVVPWLLDAERGPWIEASAAVPWAPAAPAPRVYSPQVHYQVGDTLSHPKFGSGTVQKVAGPKIEVTFADGEVRALVHAPR